MALDRCCYSKACFILTVLFATVLAHEGGDNVFIRHNNEKRSYDAGGTDTSQLQKFILETRLYEKVVLIKIFQTTYQHVLEMRDHSEVAESANVVAAFSAIPCESSARCKDSEFLILQQSEMSFIVRKTIVSDRNLNKSCKKSGSTGTASYLRYPVFNTKTKNITNFVVVFRCGPFDDNDFARLSKNDSVFEETFPHSSDGDGLRDMNAMLNSLTSNRNGRSTSSIMWHIVVCTLLVVTVIAAVIVVLILLTKSILISKKLPEVEFAENIASPSLSANSNKSVENDRMEVIHEDDDVTPRSNGTETNNRSDRAQENDDNTDDDKQPDQRDLGDHEMKPMNSANSSASIVVSPPRAVNSLSPISEENFEVSGAAPMSDSATKETCDSATRKISVSATKETSDSGTEETSDSATIETSDSGTKETSDSVTKETSDAGTEETSHSDTKETSNSGTEETSHSASKEAFNLDTAADVSDETDVKREHGLESTNTPADPSSSVQNEEIEEKSETDKLLNEGST